MLSPAAAARVQEAINRLNSPAVQSGLDKACKVASRATKVTKSGVPSLRQGYADAVSQLRDIGNSLRAAGVDSEQIARAMHADRRAIGEQFKALTPPDKLAEISARNFNKYGDNLGPTVDWLRSQGKSWDDIIESAGRIGGKDLGF